MLDPFSPVPMRSLTVKGIGLSAAIPATRRASFWGLRSRTAPRPRLVASTQHKRPVRSLWTGYAYLRSRTAPKPRLLARAARMC